MENRLEGASDSVKQEDFERRLINWLMIAFWLVLDIALIPFMLMYFFPNQASFVGDVFTWTGAIIGGGLTLVGVRYTLNRQAKERFIDVFPVKLKNLDLITERFEHILNSNRLLEFRNSNVDPIPDLIKTIKEMLNYSIDVDGTVYTLVKHFEEEVINVGRTLKEPRYNYVEDTKQMGLWSGYTDESRAAREELSEEVKEDIRDRLNKLARYRDQIQLKYVKYTNE